MKKIGLIGGVSPESTVVYYRLLNAAARTAYGGDHSAEIIIHALDFGVMHRLYASEDWTQFKAIVTEAALGLERAGCAALAISSNTTQIAADAVAEAANIPVINLIEVLAGAMQTSGVKRPLLLGTPFVMHGDFYRPALFRHGFECLIPNAPDCETVDRVIFKELVEGVVHDSSRAEYLEIIERGREAGADAVILGCTEIGMLISQADTTLPVFDTTLLHAAAIADFALQSAD